MVEPSANMSWLDPLDWKDLHAFEPVYDATNDIDSVERIAQVEAIAAALFQPFFETGLISFDSCPRDLATSNYMLRIHCARSMHGYADYSSHPSPQSSTDLEPSVEEWEHLLSDTATPTARKQLQGTPSPNRKPISNFKPKRPIHPPTPISHAKPVQKLKHSPMYASVAHIRDPLPGLLPAQSASAHHIQQREQGRIATPESDTDSGEEESGEEPIEPTRALFKQLSSSTLVNSDTQISSGAPTRDAAITDLIRNIAEDSQDIGL